MNGMNGIGSLRHVAATIMDYPAFPTGKWLAGGTAADLAKAERDYNALREVSDDDAANTVTMAMVSAHRQAAFEDGMRAGARLAVELLGVI